MIPSSYAEKHYRTAAERSLPAVLEGFFARELHRFFGPTVRRKIVEELMTIIEGLHRPSEHLKPGQCLWLAVDERTRADSPGRKLRPVILTMFCSADGEQLASGVKMATIRSEAIARIMREAHAQHGLLSMRDIELLTWHTSGTLLESRRQYEQENGCTLPHTGTLQDMGSCITHKRQIVLKVIQQGLDPIAVAQQTNHSLRAVERYVNDYQRVVQCAHRDRSIAYISSVTKIAPYVVKQYLDLLTEIQGS